MPKTKTVRVTPEEAELLKQIRKGEKAVAEDDSIVDLKGKEPEPLPESVTRAQQALAEAFVQAIERTKPKERITVANRKSRTPWNDPDVPKPKMKRKFFHHGLLLESRISGEEIDLLNRIRPGRYCEGYIVVTLRKDRGINIDYPVKTAAQRMKLVNQFGIRSFKELLRRLIDEKENPSRYRSPADKDLYDLEDQA